MLVSVLDRGSVVLLVTEVVWVLEVRVVLGLAGHYPRDPCM